MRLHTILSLIIRGEMIGNRYLKPLFEVNFSKNSIETIRLLAFDLYDVIVG